MDNIKQLEVLCSQNVVYIYELVFAFREIPLGISGKRQMESVQFVV